MSRAITVVDLREGFRVEVEVMVLPPGYYGARLYFPRTSASGRTTWKKAGPLVLADTPEQAAKDLLATMRHGLLRGVEVHGLSVASGDPVARETTPSTPASEQARNRP